MNSLATSWRSVPTSVASGKAISSLSIRMSCADSAAGAARGVPICAFICHRSVSDVPERQRTMSWPPRAMPSQSMQGSADRWPLSSSLWHARSMRSKSAQGVKDRSVLVLGGGTMGLLIAIVAELRGAGMVTLADPLSSKLEITKQAGIANAVAPQSLGSDCFDVVFEAAGVARALDQALELVEKTGALVQVGVHDEHYRGTFIPFKIYEREVRIIGSNSCRTSSPPPSISCRTFTTRRQCFSASRSPSGVSTTPCKAWWRATR